MHGCDLNIWDILYWAKDKRASLSVTTDVLTTVNIIKIEKIQLLDELIEWIENA